MRVYKATLAATLLAALTVSVSGQTNRTEALLGTGLHQEQVDGNCKEAIKTYQKVLQEKNAPRHIAARAQLHIGACQEKLGQLEARLAYELVVSRFADQADLAAEARARLATLNKSLPPSDKLTASTAGQRGGLNVEQIWEGPEIDMEGMPFNDGRSFAFADWSTGVGNLAIRDLRTGEKRVIFTSGGPAYKNFVENPLPSPDGKQIAFRFGEDDTTIRLINADGTNMRVLLHDRHDNYLTAWSPDGSYLLAKHNNPDQTATIVLISTTNGTIRPLKSMPSQGMSLGGFSPDGRFLVYAKNNEAKDGDGGVFVLAADGSAGNRLVEGSRQGATTFGSPLWSADGRRVLFMSDRSGVQGLWSIRVANGQIQSGPEPVRVNVDRMQPKVLTADGSLYYLTQEFLVEAYSAEFDPVAMKVLGHEPLTDRAVGNNRDPEPSPNGESVAFIRRRTGMPFAIVVCSLTCREERVVGTINGSGAYGARTLQWFPDSRSLLVIDAVEFRKRFRQIDVNSGEVKVLMEAPWSVWTGAVSSDGQALFYSYKEEGAVRLIKRRLDNGVETELFRAKSDGIGLFGLTASPDGTSLAYALNVENGRRALYVISTDGGTPREIHRSAPEGIWVTDIRWMTDSRALVVVGSGSVLAISAKGGDLKPLGLTMKEISGPTITPDGRRLVFGARMQREELWVVRNLLPDRAGR